MIVRMTDSEWRSRQNNLCNHMHKSKLPEFLSSENSVAKITAGYLKQENLPFPRADRKYQLHRQIRFLSGACCSINKQFSLLSSCLLCSQLSRNWIRLSDRPLPNKGLCSKWLPLFSQTFSMTMKGGRLAETDSLFRPNGAVCSAAYSSILHSTQIKGYNYTSCTCRSITQSCPKLASGVHYWHHIQQHDERQHLKRETLQSPWGQPEALWEQSWSCVWLA